MSERRGTLEFMHWCRRTPDAVALTKRGMAVSYEGLGRLVFSAMERLAAAGFGPKTRLAIAPRARVDDVVTLLAAIELKIPLVLIHPALSVKAQSSRALSAKASFEKDGAGPILDDDAILAVLFTSGSTGTPKRVRLSRRAAAAALDASASRLGWEQDDRWALILPPAHIGGLSILLRCLRAGRTVVLSEDAREIPTLVSMERVTMLSLVPTQLHRLIEARVSLPAAVRVVLVGGAPLRPALRRRAEEARYPIYATYGMTETCAQAATALPGEAGCGGLLDGLEAVIRDGVLWLRGPSLFDGYEDEASPFDDEGFFCTGDLASVDEKGSLHIHGRATERIISGGENVDPVEVEGALMNTGGFEKVCVVGIDDAEWGQVVGVVAQLPGAADVGALIARAGLPPHARPRRLLLHELPLTAVGKIDRAACKKLAHNDGWTTL